MVDYHVLIQLVTSILAMTKEELGWEKGPRKQLMILKSWFFCDYSSSTSTWTIKSKKMFEAPITFVPSDRVFEKFVILM